MSKLRSVSNDGKTFITAEAFGEKVLRITISCKREPVYRDYNILKPGLKPECANAGVISGAGKEILETKHLRFEADKNSGGIMICEQGGRKLFNTDRAPVFSEVPVTRHVNNADSVIITKKTADGEKQYLSGGQDEIIRTAYTVRLPLCFEKDEAIYGFGSLEDGKGNLAGSREYLYQQNLRAFVPVMISNRGYGILFNCGCACIFDDEKEHILTFDCVDELDMYIFAGSSHTEMMEGYYYLTGKQPLMPKYLFGYIQSKEHYSTSKELVDVVAGYRQLGVPLDVIVQDWLYWKEGMWGQKSVDPVRYPDLKALTEELHRMHAKLMVSIWPTMSGEGCSDAADMKEHGFMLGNGTNYDPFIPEARQLYWKQTREQLFKYGVDLWWCDCTEPFEADWIWSEDPKPSEEERYKLNTSEAIKYLERDKIILYCLYHTMGLYEGMRGCSDKRAVILTRSSCAGQHRYGTVTWSGDIEASWERLRAQIPAAVNFTCTGEALWNFDIGAFFTKNLPNAWFWSGDYQDGTADMGYRELYTRWLECAVFMPLMRSHGTDTPREIWQFGKRGEMFFDAIEKNIRLRYALMPYIYSLAADTAFRSRAMMLPLGLVFPDDVRSRDCTGQYMFGDLLVCPVTEPMYYGAGSEALTSIPKQKEVYLPAGIWYDYYTGESYAGGVSVMADAPIDRIPVFVRAGAIIFSTEAEQYADEKKDAPVTVSVYPGADGEQIYYDDDGETYSYEKGGYENVSFRWDDKAGKLTVGERTGGYPGMPEKRQFLCKVVGRDQQTEIYRD